MAGERKTGAKVRVAAAVLMLVLSVALLSCARRLPVAPPQIPMHTGPVDAQVLRKSLAFKGLRSIKSEVRVAAYRDGESLGRFSGILAYSAPGSMRLRLLSPLGFTAMDVLVSGRLLQVYISGRKTLYEGQAPALGIPEDASYAMEAERDGYTLYAFRPSRGAKELAGKFSFEAETLLNTGMTLYNGGRRYMGIMLDGFSGGLPMSLRMSFFNNMALEVELEEPELDAVIPEKYFAPISHSGKTVLPIQSLLDGHPR